MNIKLRAIRVPSNMYLEGQTYITLRLTIWDKSRQLKIRFLWILEVTFKSQRFLNTSDGDVINFFILKQKLLP